MRAFRKFFVETSGFAAAEKALITLLALAMILVVARYILAGSTTAAGNVQKVLQQPAPPSTQ